MVTKKITAKRPASKKLAKTLRGLVKAKAKKKRMGTSSGGPRKAKR